MVPGTLYAGTKTVREEIKITPAKVERIIYVQHNYA